MQMERSSLKLFLKLYINRSKALRFLLIKSLWYITLAMQGDAKFISLNSLQLLQWHFVPYVDKLI